jgi:hypothetical protein
MEIIAGLGHRFHRGSMATYAQMTAKKNGT